MRSIQRRMFKLEHLGVIAGVTFMQSRPRRRGRYVPPLKGGLIYVLTPTGVEVLKQRYPTEPLEYEKLIVRADGTAHQAEHQIEYADFIVQMLLMLGQLPGVVGVNSSAEMQLGQGRTPRCDGFLVVRRWINAVTVRTTPLDVRTKIPWLQGPKEPGQVDRTYAIEVDRGTEDLHVIAGKARSYLAVYQSGWWRGRYQFPGTVFLVPDVERREEVVVEWLRGWPSGMLLITTKPEFDAHGLAGPIWHEYAHGQHRVRTFFDSWSQPVIAPPVEDGGDTNDAR